MDITQKLNQYAYSNDELQDMNALVEIAMFMEQDVNRLDEAFSVGELGKMAGGLLKKAGLHLHKGDGLIQIAMKSGKVMGQFLWYALKAASGDKEAKVKVKELANTEITKEQMLDFLLKLDMATLHVLTGPLHTIDAITGWHLWANVKDKADQGLKKAKEAIGNLIQVAKTAEQSVKDKLKGYMHGIAKLIGLDTEHKAIQAL
jgi:hypothetical protein